MNYKAPPMEPNRHLDHNHRYGCFDRDDVREVEYSMQDGFTGDGRRKLIYHKTNWDALEEKCGNSYRATDPSCTGCKWRTL